jgi:hypothetical protein
MFRQRSSEVSKAGEKGVKGVNTSKLIAQGETHYPYFIL